MNEIRSPAGAEALGAAWAAEPVNAPRLSWVETGAKGSDTRLFAATLDVTTRTWQPAHEITYGRGIGTDSADLPQLAFGADGGMAAWSDGNGGARISRSHDDGATWSQPAPWTTGHQAVGKITLAVLADGRVLAAWLDERARSGKSAPQLHARTFGSKPGIDQCIDPDVCDSGPISLVPLLDGGAAVAYRGRTSDNIRDIRVARLRHGGWTEPRVLNPDGGRIAGCADDGPRLATDGSRLAAVWFTGAQDDPRVLVSYSPDAGARWLRPLRIDLGNPAGHADVLLLRDGAILVTWLERDGSVWLRRVTPEFAATDPLRLAPADRAGVRGLPRLRLQQDYDGGHSVATFLVAYPRTGTGLRIQSVTVVEGDLLERERNCNCTPTAEELRGFALRGRLDAVNAKTNTVTVTYDEIPGVMDAGTGSFRVSPLLLPALRPGAEFLGRIERHEAHWWLRDVRWLAETPAPMAR